jgi:hypothetical protein
MHDGDHVVCSRGQTANVNSWSLFGGTCRSARDSRPQRDGLGLVTQVLAASKHALKTLCCVFSSMQMAAAIFAAEMESHDSPHRPYFDALPSPDELLCPLISLPAEYLHLLQSPKAVGSMV